MPKVVALVVVEAIFTVLWKMLLVVPPLISIPLIEIFPVEFGALKSPIRLLLTVLVPVAAVVIPVITALVLFDERSYIALPVTVAAPECVIPLIVPPVPPVVPVLFIA